MTTLPRKLPRKIRFLKITLTLFVVSALLLQLSAPIFSFRIVLKTQTDIYQCGTSGGDLRLIHTAYGTQAVRDEWSGSNWDQPSDGFFHANFVSPFLTLGWPGFRTLEDWTHLGLTRQIYECNSAEDPTAPKFQQRMIQARAFWLIPFWLGPIALWLLIAWRSQILKAELRTTARRLLAVAAVLSLLLCLTVAIFWCRSYWWSDRVIADFLYEVIPGRSQEPSFPGEYTRTRFYSVGFYPNAFRFSEMSGGGSGSHTRLRHYVSPSDPSISPSQSDFDATAEPHSKVWALPALHIAVGDGIESSSSRILIRPWLLQILTLIVPTTWLLLYLRRKRRAQPSNHPLCPTCSYDLHAHNLGDRCPECGSPITSPNSPPKTQ